MAYSLPFSSVVNVGQTGDSIHVAANCSCIISTLTIPFFLCVTDVQNDIFSHTYTKRTHRAEIIKTEIVFFVLLVVVGLLFIVVVVVGHIRFDRNRMAKFHIIWYGKLLLSYFYSSWACTMYTFFLSFLIFLLFYLSIALPNS